MECVIINKTVNKILDCLKIIEENTCEFNSEEVLCAFDIDNTITVLECKYSYWPNICLWRSEYDRLVRQYNIDTNLAYTYLLSRYPLKIFDKEIYKLINALKCKKIMVTASLTGRFEGIELLEKFRYDRLKNSGISFVDEFSVEDYIRFTEFKSNFSNYPSYYKGILSTNGEKSNVSKGEILKSFFQKVGYSPKCIILIDDNCENHKSINVEFSSSVKKIINITYTGTDNYCPIKVNLDEFICFWDNLFKGISVKVI